MAEQVTIDKAVFHNRLAAFLAAWKTDKRSGDSLFGGADSIVLLVGKASDAGDYQKTNAFQLWLLGYEFPATLLILTQATAYVLTTKKKASFLEPLRGGKVNLEILVRGKDAQENAKHLEHCTDVIKSAGRKVGVLSKDSAVGPFVDEWKAAYGDIAKSVEEVDIAVAVSSAALSVKDEKELRHIRDAARASSAVMADHFVDAMSDILDAEKKTSHRKLARNVQDKLEDSKFFQKLKLSPDFDPMNLDWAVLPTVQSGGQYDLRFAAEPDDNNLHAGVILSALGLRYNSYAAMIARTYLVDPNKAQESNYKLLLSIHELVIKESRNGVLAKDVYNKARKLLRSKKPEYEKHFPDSVGYAIGLENRDDSLVLDGQNSRSLKDGMTLCIATGLSGLPNASAPDKKGSTYSLALVDTVRVAEKEAALFTKDAPCDLESTSFFFKDEDGGDVDDDDDDDDDDDGGTAATAAASPAKPRAKTKKDSRIGAVASNNITKTRLRAERTTNQDAEREAARREHQKELHSKKQQQGQERYRERGGSVNGTEQKTYKRFESYKRDNQFPAKVKDLVVVIDAKSATIVLPVMGRPVPFHVNTIKSASNTAEGAFTYLRINFMTPGQGFVRKDDQPFEDPTAHFLRSVTIRSRDVDRMEDVTRQITELKKSAVRKEQEKKNLEDVVEQDKLIEIRNRRPFRLENLFVRPAMEGKRLAGHVEIHQNGLRYLHPLGSHSTIDILFSNVKHLFFQPSVSEMIVIIHVHLINPIVIGKRKAKDVQFYREASEMQFDETGTRKRKHRYGDEEEFEAEQEERRRRALLDREFKNFAERIADASRAESVQVDIPFRELGFYGVHSRSSVLIQPTTDCLVQLTEPPFLVITLSDIEIVHLERVQFGLKNFDMVVVYRDFQRAPAHLNTIPVECLEGIKDWLDSIEIPFSEGQLNLNWATIMKTVTADPHQFFADGGWSFIANESDSDAEDEEEDESAFEMSESELAESEESSEEDSDFDANASADADDDADASGDESGDDWDELERKAQKKDSKGNFATDDDGGGGGGGKSKSPKKKPAK